MANPHPFAILNHINADSGIPYVSLSQRALVSIAQRRPADSSISDYGQRQSNSFASSKAPDTAGWTAPSGDRSMRG